MNDILPEPPPSRHAPNTQNPTRRRLLRAAASATPLIATLPSGAAAQALNSLFQCVAADKNASDAAIAGGLPADYRIPPPEIPQDPDHFVRTPAKQVTWSKPGTSGTPPVPSKTVSTFLLSGNYYREDTGSKWDYDGDTDPTEIAKWSAGPQVDAAVLNVYRPTYTAGIDDPTGIELPCADSKDTNLPGGGCLFPVARRKAGFDGNMGITGTCLGSVLG